MWVVVWLTGGCCWLAGVELGEKEHIAVRFRDVRTECAVHLHSPLPLSSVTSTVNTINSAVVVSSGTAFVVESLRGSYSLCLSSWDDKRITITVESCLVALLAFLCHPHGTYGKAKQPNENIHLSAGLTKLGVIVIPHLLVIFPIYLPILRLSCVEKQNSKRG